ncbi:DNA-directed RNA polymerase I subunit 42/43 [Pelomyxa schiedti]|nr:DNA-directed RNA polymerase I subunit 42/43 [Pelomyxa schiedti]
MSQGSAAASTTATTGATTKPKYGRPTEPAYFGAEYPDPGSLNETYPTEKPPPFDLAIWKDSLRMELQSYTKESGQPEENLVVDIVGIDASLANALRRILLSEVPTMCIENVYVNNNTSVMPDEVLAHRLGLIPLDVDPRKFCYRTGSDFTDEDTTQMKLKVKCTADPINPKALVHQNVYSRDLQWIPVGDQETTLEKPITPVHPDILITKLAKNQEIDVDCFVMKGVGKDHAKFSPVATAAYRLLPNITFKKRVAPRELSQKLVDTCPMHVFDIENADVVVSSPRACTMCRECVRGDWSAYVSLGQIKDHFIFSIDTTGILPAPVLFKEALLVLIEKCERIARDIEGTSTHSL